MDQRPLLFFSFCLFLLLSSVALSVYATEENSDGEGSQQSVKEVNAMMEDNRESKTAVGDLRKENQALKKELQEYRKLEEELIAKRVYEKAKKRLIGAITVGGIVLTVLGLVGLKSAVDYTKKLVVGKLESVSEDQVNRIVQEEGRKQVRAVMEEQESELKKMLAGAVKDQMRLISLPSAGVPGRERSELAADQVPRRLDLTSSMTPVRNQGSEGSTVGFAVAAALEYQIQKHLKEQVIISPRYLYYYAKEEAGYDPHADTGAFVRDAVKVLRTSGAVSEESWPYIPGDLQSDPPEGIETARRYRITDSYSVTSVEEIKAALQKYGPVAGGLPVYREGLYDEDAARTGIIPDPSRGARAFASIAICIVGYDDDKKLIKFKNSWGTGWGDSGYGYVSYDYVDKFLMDAWVFTI